MADLQSCYFCGDHEGVGEYAVVPPRFAPTEDERRSVVLCDRCKDKLLTVIQPLIDRLDGGGEGGEDSRAGDAGVEDAGVDVGDAGVGVGDADDADDGITFPGDVDVSDDRAGEGDERADDDVDEGAAEAATADDPATAGEEPASTSGDAGPPPGYRKAIRMLSNRPFPVERTAVVDLLSGAYDMEAAQAEAIIDHAVERGRFVEDGGELRET